MIAPSQKDGTGGESSWVLFECGIDIRWHDGATHEISHFCFGSSNNNQNTIIIQW